jgi:hypothetical protein
MAGSRNPRPVGRHSNPVTIDSGTLNRHRSPAPGSTGIHYLPQEDVSIELSDAPAMCVPASVSEISLAEMRVLAWLQAHKQEIAAAEKRFKVDRRAIAGAIAWEATRNVRGSLEGAFGRFVGPGKSHVWSVSAGMIPAITEDTLVKQVEDATWLPAAERIPKQSYGDRKALLATATGSITYIAAAMNAAAHVAEDAGFPSIRKRPEVLAFFWQKRDLDSWRDHLKKKPKGSDFQTGPNPAKDMDLWVRENLRFLEDGVGQPDF